MRISLSTEGQYEERSAVRPRGSTGVLSANVWALAMLAITGCATLLDADFEDMAETTLDDEAVALPGPPNGDRMIITNIAGINTPPGGASRQLEIYRSAVVGAAANHGAAYFDPLPASGDRSIFFSWAGLLVHAAGSGVDPPVVAVKLQDLVDDDQPNLFSKLTIRFGPDKITAATQGGNEVEIGNGVSGRHGVILRVDPGPKTYAFHVGGDGVSPGGGFTHTGSLAPDTTIDPENIGVTITFADEINAGGSAYLVDDVRVSERTP